MQDMNDVMLEASAIVTEVLREVAIEILKVEIQRKMMMSYMASTPEMKEQFKQEKPAEYQAVPTRRE